MFLTVYKYRLKGKIRKFSTSFSVSRHGFDAFFAFLCVKTSDFSCAAINGPHFSGDQKCAARPSQAQKWFISSFP